jgi:TonB-linked SusC/RagA family outer membrane protein
MKIIYYWRVMRLILLLMIVGCLSLSANTYSQTISLKGKQLTMDQIFSSIEKQTGFRVAGKRSIIQKASRMDIHLDKIPLQDFLDTIFENQPITYIRVDNNILIKEKENWKSLEKETRVPLVNAIDLGMDMSGRVLDSLGNPLIGATIVILTTDGKTTKWITQTDNQGRFKFVDVPENTQITISFMGFEPQTRKSVANLGDIILKTRMDLLDEVEINAGYYSVRDIERTGSIARVTAKTIATQPSNNVLSNLQGRLSGVHIIQNSGVPGGGFTVQIRGKNSLRNDGNEPLYIVDGMPILSNIQSSLGGTIVSGGQISGMNAINPADIASIEILKDADATAIYGSRGANGVILITTKKSNTKKGIHLTADHTSTMGRIINTLDMMNTDQYISMRKAAFQNDGVAQFPANAYDINGTWDQQRNTNWQKELLGGTAVTHQQNLGISTANENTSFSILASNREESTVFPGTFHFNKFTLSSNLGYRSTDGKLAVHSNLLFGRNANNLPNNDLTRTAYTLSPNAPALYDNKQQLNWENGTFTNPLAALNAEYNAVVEMLNAAFDVRYQWSNFKVSTRFGINKAIHKETRIQPHTIYNPNSLSGSSSKYSNLFISDLNSNSYIIEPQLTYLNKWNKLQYEIMLGSSYQTQSSNQMSMNGSDFLTNDFLENLSAANVKNISAHSLTDYRYLAFFGRLNLNIDQKIFLNFTSRRDGSSRFGPDNRFAHFNALGAAWMVSQEAWFPQIKEINSLKLRGSFGTSGSDHIGNYQFLDTYTIRNSVYNGNIGLAPTRLYNPDFSWEKTYKSEIALTTALFNNRMEWTIAAFNNLSKNQLVGVPLPYTTGFNTIQDNLNAKVQNKGLEIELEAKIIAKQAFNWTSSFNLTLPHNQLLAFPDLEQSSFANTYVVGKSTFIKKTYTYTGLDPTTGIFTFQDYNLDKTITSASDRKGVVDLQPRFYGGWNNHVSYKNLSIDFLFQFYKGDNHNFIFNSGLFGHSLNLPVAFLDAWRTDHTNAQYQPYTSGQSAAASNAFGYFRESDQAFSDASYVRLKNVHINYLFNIQNRIKFNVFVNAHNLLTWTNYFGYDPEFLNIGFLPPLKSISFGSKFNF